MTQLQTPMETMEQERTHLGIYEIILYKSLQELDVFYFEDSDCENILRTLATQSSYPRISGIIDVHDYIHEMDTTEMNRYQKNSVFQTGNTAVFIRTGRPNSFLIVAHLDKTEREKTIKCLDDKLQ